MQQWISQANRRREGSCRGPLVNAQLLRAGTHQTTRFTTEPIATLGFTPNHNFPLTMIAAEAKVLLMLAVLLYPFIQLGLTRMAIICSSCLPYPAPTSESLR